MSEAAQPDLLDDGYVSVPVAARMLGVSPPTMVALLNAKRIPYTTPSKHRRIRICDLAQYQKRVSTRGRRPLREPVEDLLRD